MNRRKNGKILLHVIFFSVFFILTLLNRPVFAEEIEIPLLPRFFDVDGEFSVDGGKASFEVDKGAKILLKLKNISDMEIAYESHGYFLLTFITAKRNIYKIYPKFLTGIPIKKGKGSIKLDLTRTVDWSPETYPLLMLDGTGKFIISAIKISTIKDISEYQSKQDSSFFWRAESLRSTLMNYITPVYWSFSKRIELAKFMGILFMSFFLLLYLAMFFFKKNLVMTFQTVSLVFMLAFAMHYTIRLIPVINVRFYLHNNEKIKRYFPVPEVGQLVSAARELTNPKDKVIVVTDDGAWFARRAACFHIAPVDCVYYYTPDVNVVVSYNSAYQLLEGFSKIYELNKNVFIARKK